MPTVPQGFGRLYQYAKLMNHYPLVAIRGIDKDSIHAVARSGVGSVAVVRALTQAKDPKAAVKHLQELMEASQRLGAYSSPFRSFLFHRVMLLGRSRAYIIMALDLHQCSRNALPLILPPHMQSLVQLRV